MDTNVLISAVVAAVAACAVLAAMGFKGRLDTVGIDLGTTYSVVALRNGLHTDVLRDASGRALVPSAVYFAPDGSMAVGHDALLHQHRDPRHVIFNAKRFIGRSFEDAAVGAQSRLHPFHVVPNASASHSGAWFDLSKQHGGKHNASVSPETVGEQILRHLLDVAAFNMGHRQVRKAVMAVPAKFDAEQRMATAEAYKQAGLKVMRVIEEPTAAALAYGLDKKENVDYILVYDFGGGTLDVSLLFVNKESVQVIATHGDDQLGGADFDLCLAADLRQRLIDQMKDGTGFEANDCPSMLRPSPEEALRAAQLFAKGFEEIVETPRCVRKKKQRQQEQEQEQQRRRANNAAMGAVPLMVKLAGGGGGGGGGGGFGASAAGVGGVAEGQGSDDDEYEDPNCVLPCTKSNVRVLAERIKRELSSAEPGWAVGHCVARKPQESTGFGDCRVRKLNVTRSDFERTCDGLFQRVLAPVSALLEEANMPKGEIDEVVLVGGSSRIPRIRDELRAFFDIDHLNTEIDPDVTVAIGAASIVD
jgi:molecular chaperone DnaK (HSP70)